MMKVWMALLGWGWALGTAALQEDFDAPHVRVYRKVAPSVVAVRGGGQAGSGVLIDPSGIILTSPTACGTSTETVTVVVRGNRSFRGRVLGRVNEKELVLVQIDPPGLPAVELGDSDTARVGQTVYVLGDCFGSLYRDDQPAISLGVISGIYEIRKRQRGTYYTGKVLETSAAVNPEQDGGPLVDREGRLLGIVTLNYEESRFTGLAIPINELKADIERIRRGPEAVPAGGTRGAWLGVETRATREGLEVTRVSPRSPAEQAGIRRGDILRRAGEVRLSTRAALDRILERKRPGDSLEVELLRGADILERTVVLAKKPVY